MEPGTEQYFYLHGQETWDAMLTALKNATVSIDLEQYIFANDVIGQKFLEVIRERRAAGVKVRILVDTVGSWFLYNSFMPRTLRGEGIEVRFFNPISPWRIGSIFSWFFRDHRKLLIVDNVLAFTGGIGIRDDMASWRDTNVAVSGPIVAEMKHAFEEMWQQTQNKDLMSRIKNARRYVRGFHFLTNAPYWKKRFLYQNIIDAVRNARSSVCLTTPYFIPDRRLRRVLRLARRRGVDVRVLVPKITNRALVGYAGHSYYEKLFKSGVRIFQYTGEFLHAKTAVVDDEWATVGSFNLDSLSFLYNYEANIVSTEKSVVDILRDHFFADLKNAEEINPREWHNRAFSEKVWERLILPLRRFL